MKKRINTGFMLIAAIAIVVTAVCSMFLFYQILEEQIFDDLKANAQLPCNRNGMFVHIHKDIFMYQL